MVGSLKLSVIYQCFYVLSVVNIFHFLPRAIKRQNKTFSCCGMVFSIFDQFGLGCSGLDIFSAFICRESVCSSMNIALKGVQKVF